AAAALGALAAGAEDVGGAARAGPNGRIDLTLANGPADADIHAETTTFPMKMRLTRRRNLGGHSDSVKRPESPEAGTFAGFSAARHRSDAASFPSAGLPSFRLPRCTPRP